MEAASVGRERHGRFALLDHGRDLSREVELGAGEAGDLAHEGSERAKG
jgi:hypothetical protein